MKPAFQNQEAFWAVALAVALSFGFLPGYLMDAGWLPKLLILSIISMGGLFWSLFKGRRVTNVGLLMLLSLWIFSCLPAAFVSDNTGGVWMTLSRFCLLFTLTVLFNSLFDRDSLKRFVFYFALAMLATLSVWGSFELATAMDGLSVSHESTYDVITSMGHRNVFVQFLCLLIPFSFAGLSLKRNLRTPVSITIFIAILLSVLLLNRSAWVALVVIGFGLLFHDYKTKDISKELGISFWKVILLTVLGIGAILLLFVDEPYTLWHHVEMTLNLDSGTTRDRILLAERSFELFKTAPLFGIGLGMWKVLIMSFSQDGMLTESARIFYQRPHNDYLWVLSETGFVSGILYLGLHAIGVVTSIRNYRSNSSLWSLAVLLTWAIFILNSITIFPIERPEYLLMLALLVAVTFSSNVGQRIWDQRKSISNFILITGIGLSLLGSAFYIIRLKSELNYYSGRKHRDAGEWQRYNDQMLKVNQDALTIDQISTPIVYHIGLSNYLLEHTSEAVDQFHDALALNPYHPEIWNNLGMTYANQNRFDRAYYCFENAVRFTSSYQKAWLNIAAIQYQTGHWRSAFKSYQRADSTDASELYKQLGSRLAIDSLDQLLKKTENRKMYKTLEAFRNTPEWSYDIMVKSSMNGISFNQQAHLDACYYMLKNCQLYEDCELVDRVIEAYLPNGKGDLNLNE